MKSGNRAQPGQTIACPKCETYFQVPEADEAPSAAKTTPLSRTKPLAKADARPTAKTASLGGVKKTAKLIYYTSDSWDRREAIVSPGCISREQFETDTRCRDNCPRDIAAGLVYLRRRRRASSRL